MKLTNEQVQHDVGDDDVERAEVDEGAGVVATIRLPVAVLVWCAERRLYLQNQSGKHKLNTGNPESRAGPTWKEFLKDLVGHLFFPCHIIIIDHGNCQWQMGFSGSDMHAKLDTLLALGCRTAAGNLKVLNLEWAHRDNCWLTMQSCIILFQSSPVTMRNSTTMAFPAVEKFACLPERKRARNKRVMGEGGIRKKHYSLISNIHTTMKKQLLTLFRKVF